VIFVTPIAISAVRKKGQRSGRIGLTLRH